MSNPEPVRESVHARDGQPLSATRFEPEAEAAATVVIAPAMAVGQGFYADFAEALARRGFRALTFDYRGMGRSRGDRAPARWRTTVRTWANLDYAGVVDSVVERWPDRRVFVVGHSLGGQLVGLLPNAGHVDGLVTVAAGSGWWGHHPSRGVRRLQMEVFLPTVTRLFGYFPGRKLGVLGDIPEGAALEWARWCSSPHYVVDAQGRPDREGFRAYTGAVLGISFADDDLLVKAAIDDLHGWFGRAPVERHHLDPGDLGLESVGHFGFFRPSSSEALWPLVFEWLTARAASPSGPGLRSARKFGYDRA